MKKKIVSLALSLSTIFTIAAGNTMNASASCSGWTENPVGIYHAIGLTDVE